jgi:dTDP-4-amino-4,6-dideoxygalactose transaminase
MWKMRKRIASRYTEALRGTDGLVPYTVRPDRESAWYLYPVDCDPGALAISRDRFIELMRDRGVGMSVHFIPLYEFTYYKKLGYSGSDFNNCRRVYERTMSLPIFPGMTDAEIDYVIDNVVDVAKKNKR